jgi:RNA polymerase sigma-70 factor (ECF subfamily)
MADYEDKALLNDLFNGMESAFREIYDRYYDKLYLSCFGIVQHTQEAEDIVVITFSKLFKRHANFQSLGQVQTWLFLTARNNCIDALRSRRSSQAKLEAAVELNSPSAENQAINDELDALLVERLFQLVEELPRQSRQVIRLRYLEGLKYRDIGAKLNISPRTVENLLRYALERLRSRMSTEKLALLLAILNFL